MKTETRMEEYKIKIWLQNPEGEICYIETKATEDQLNTLREFSKQAHTKFITATITATTD
jgi:hypothetical protein